MSLTKKMQPHLFIHTHTHRGREIEIKRGTHTHVHHTITASSCWRQSERAHRTERARESEKLGHLRSGDDTF